MKFYSDIKYQYYMIRKIDCNGRKFFSFWIYIEYSRLYSYQSFLKKVYKKRIYFYYICKNWFILIFI